jgi:membrane-associated protease RseP (regulator of RpoE activity)
VRESKNDFEVANETSSRDVAESDVPDAPETLRWKLPLLLFVATVFSTFYVGAGQALQHDPLAYFQQRRSEGFDPALHAFFWAMGHGWVFAVPLLSILLCHEFGHYLMARKHQVPASLPMFIPFPNLFGTMGAVIAMPGRIRTRDALVDIGAAGPLAGLAVAIPVTILGLMLSTVEPMNGRTNVLVEGDSLLYLALKFLVCGRIPPGSDVWLHPVAFAGWAGFFVTMMNLLPIGQLDGGHVAYALFGLRQDRWSRWVSYCLLALAVSIAVWVWHSNPGSHHDSSGYTPAIIWAMWALLSRGVMRISGDRHPPTSDAPLSPLRRRVAVFTLACFVFLFMPLPIRLV